MKINHAVLHVLDFTSGVTVFSQRELDLESRQVRGFVEKHLRKVRRDEAARRGSFAADSSFAAELRSYFFGERDFIGMSTQIADFLVSELGRAEKPESADVLVADFEDDELAGEDATDDGTGQRFFAVLLLASRQAFMHEVRSDDGRVGAEIARHYAILPNPSQKVASYAVVRARGMAVAYADKKRAINGEDVMLIPDGLLQCEAGVSAKEAIDTVTRIVEEVAEEFGTNSAVALSRAKNSLVEQAEEGESFSPERLGREIFEDAPQLQERFAEEAAKEELPQSVPVEHAVAERRARNHRIRTDTGIEVTFPSEYCDNADYIEFVNNPNGLISIELKNIGKITNR